jgi:hypothetical protein
MFIPNPGSRSRNRIFPIPDPDPQHMKGTEMRNKTLVSGSVRDAHCHQDPGENGHYNIINETKPYTVPVQSWGGGGGGGGARKGEKL